MIGEQQRAGWCISQTAVASPKEGAVSADV